MQQIKPSSTVENPENNLDPPPYDHDIDAPPNTGARQFVLNINYQTPTATYPLAIYPNNTNESYHRVTYILGKRWKSDICRVLV